MRSAVDPGHGPLRAAAGAAQRGSGGLVKYTLVTPTSLYALVNSQEWWNLFPL